MGTIVRLTPAGPISFKRRSLEPATETYVTEDDRIVFGVRSVTAVGIFFRARVQKPDGTIVLVEETHSPNQISSSAPVSHVFRLTEGFLLSAGISTQSETLLPGECYVWAHIVSAGVNDRTATRVLLAGYLSAGYALGWPDSRIVPPGAGPSLIAISADLSPAVGDDPVAVTTPGLRTRIISFTGLLTTDVSLSERTVRGVLLSGTDVLFDGRCATVQLESKSHRYSFIAGAGDYTSHKNAAVIPGPRVMELPSGVSVKFLTVGKQAGDAWTAVFLLSETWVLPGIV